MMRMTLTGLRAHRARLLLAAVSIVIGVAFVAGTLVIGDTLKATTERTVTANAAKVDVAVLGQSAMRKLPRSLAADISRVDGVDEVQGTLQGTATLLDGSGRPFDGEPVAMSVTMRTEIARGRAPSAANEAVLAEATARSAGLRVGDRITVLDRQGAQHRFRLSGLMDTTGDGSLALRGAMAFTPDAAAMITGETEFGEIYVTSANVAPDRLRTAVAAAAGEGPYDIVTGRQWADEKAASSGIDPAVLAAGLLLFGAVALLVAGFVIYNTFAILVAQRTRELALLRCVGASRGQVFRGVLLESAVVGAAASAVGLAAGIAAGFGAVAVINAFGVEIPGDAVTVRPLTLVLSPLAGLLVTTAAAVPPARAATRVAPIAALNTTVGPRTARTGRARIAAGALACALGATAALVAVMSEPGQQTPLILAVGGGTAFFLGVVALGPVIIGPLVRFAGYLPGRLLGVPGRLAVVNARRNPRRAATTTITLAIGVTLMTGVAVVVGSASESMSVGVEKAIPADFVISAPGSGPRASIPASVVDDLHARTEVTAMAAQRESIVEIDGRPASVGTVTIGGPVKTPAVIQGSRVDAIEPDQIAISPDRAAEFGVGVGDTLDVRVGGRAVPLEVAALVRGNPFPPFYVSEQGFAAHFGERGYTAVLVDVSPQLSAPDSRRIIDDATASFPTATILGLHDVREQLESTLSNFVLIIMGLLWFAVLISFLGIANTMTLSVVERTRESAVLRALGLTRRHLGRMLGIEALVLGVVGALIGVALGVGFGLAVSATVRADIVLVVPYGQICAIVVGSGLAGLLAAVLPARRAAGTSITGALAAQ